VPIADGIDLFIVLHEEALRINTSMVDHVLGSSVVLVEVSQIVADEN
jgi:hypothetical protein